MDQLRVYTRYLFHNRVKTSGRNLRLGKGGLGLVLFGSSNEDGLKVLAPADIQNLSLEDKLAFQVGQADKKLPSTLDDKKNLSTIAFRLKDVVKVGYNEPDYEVTEDEFIVGYDGVNADSALEIPEGEHRVFEIQLKNGMLSLFNAGEDHLISFDMYREEGQTMQEVVTEAIKNLNETGFSLYDKYDKLVDISVIDSSSTPGDTNFVIYELDLSNANESQVPLAVGVNQNLKGFVQSQYDDFDIKEVSPGKFAVMIEEATTPGDEKPTDFAMPAVLSVLDSCDDCPDDYTPTTEGYVYSVKMNDAGADEATAIEAAFTADDNVTEASAEKIDNNEPKGNYIVVTDGVADVTAIEDLDAAEILLIGHTDDICTKSESASFSWVQVDGACAAKVEEWTITLPDTKCGDTREDELAAAYNNDTVAVGDGGGCNHNYTMDVVTNVVCDECDDIYLDLFESEQPAPFEGNEWKKDTSWSDTALMGFRVKAKRIVNIPPMYLQDMGNINTAVDISVSAGICLEGDAIDDTCPEDKDISVLKVATNKDPVNMGYQLKFFEDRDSNFLGGRNPKGNLQSRYLQGDESLLEPDKQYVFHTVTVMDAETRDHVNEVTYSFPSKIGYQGPIEDLLNALAGKLGLEGVKSL